MNLKTLYYFGLLLTLTFANSRVSFSRPGSMMSIPGYSLSETDNLFSVGIATEIVDLNESNQSTSAYFNSITNSGVGLGLSVVQHANPFSPIDEDFANYEPTTEVGIHFQKKVYSYGNVKIDLGVQDVIYESESTNNTLSLFANFSSHKEFDNFALTSLLGFGTGKISNDPQNFANTNGEDEESSSGVFLGFHLNTPYLKNNGGVNIIAEYDGQGVNMGCEIPLTSEYRVGLGITNFQNLSEFGTQGDTEAEDRSLLADAPAISFGISMNIPRIKSSFDETSGPISNSYELPEDLVSAEHAYKQAGDIIANLRDSLKVAQFELDNISDSNINLAQKTHVLEDSTRKHYLDVQISKSNLNAAMRHLSKSLRLFYEQEYKEALKEANRAIELNPELAIAYARKGSIYFKLGDQQRATINWNIALKLDPEYSEVRDMLQAIKENRLRSVEL